jgi:hypothetical protein
MTWKIAISSAALIGDGVLTLVRPGPLQWALAIVIVGVAAVLSYSYLRADNAGYSSNARVRAGGNASLKRHPALKWLNSRRGNTPPTNLQRKSKGNKVAHQKKKHPR